MLYGSSNVCRRVHMESELSKDGLWHQSIYCFSIDFIIQNLLCDNRAGPFKHFSFAASIMLSFVSGRWWRDTAGQRNFSSWFWDAAILYFSCFYHMASRSAQGKNTVVLHSACPEHATPYKFPPLALAQWPSHHGPPHRHNTFPVSHHPAGKRALSIQTQ